MDVKFFLSAAKVKCESGETLSSSSSLPCLMLQGALRLVNFRKELRF